jgi:membrane protease YdiL (CAAX protease family)
MAESTPDIVARDASETLTNLAPPTTNCWRCGKPAPFDCSTCPTCQARLRQTVAIAPRPKGDAAGLVAVMLWIVGLQLAVSVLFGTYRHFAPHEPETTRLALSLTAKAAYSSITLVGVWLFARAGVPSRLPAKLRPSVWIWSWPVLGLLLGANLGFHALLRNYLRVPPDLFIPTAPHQYRILWILAICVQPAIFEELCFRGIVLRALTPVMSVGTAVLIASIAFAMAHLFQLTALPYLFLVGVFLGIARTSSGGLALPMLLHAAHNACVLWIRWHR